MFAYAVIGYWMLAGWLASLCYCAATDLPSDSDASDAEKSPILESPAGSYC